jgi:hypothetical protein
MTTAEKIQEQQAEEQALTGYVPAIFIGLGGSGTTIVSSLRTKLRATHGKDAAWGSLIDQVYQFFAVDTMDLTPEARGLRDDNYFRFGGFHGGRQADFFWKNPPYSHGFRQWWYPGHRPGFLWPGAGQVRINGRLALLHNLLSGERKFVNVVMDACERVRNVLLEQVPHENPFVNIYIFSSVCGGTGAGLFIDLAYAVRDALEGVQPRIHAYLLLPEVLELVVPQNRHEQLRANAAGALRELDFWQNPNRGIDYSFSLGDRQIGPRPGPAFNLVHLIDRTNEKNRVITDFDLIHRLVADTVYYDAIESRASWRTQSPRHNTFQTFETTPTVADPESGRPRPWSYGSATMVVMRFPLERIARHIATIWMGKIIREHIWKEEESEAEKTKDDLVRRAGWAEAALQQSLDEELKKRQATQIPTTYKTNIGRSSKDKLSQQYETTKRLVEARRGSWRRFLYGEEGKGGERERRADAFVQLVREQVKEALDGKNTRRFGTVLQFLERLENRLRGATQASEAQPESKTLASDIEERKREVQDLEANLERRYEEARAAGMFTYKARRNDLVKAFYDLFERSKTLALRLAVKDIYERALGGVTALREKLKAIRKDALHPIQNLAEGTPSSTTGAADRLADEPVGIVLEVLYNESVKQRQGESVTWAEAQERELAVGDKGEPSVLYSDVVGRVVGLACANGKAVLGLQLDEAEKELIVPDQGESAAQRYYECLLETTVPLIRNHIAEEVPSLWTALEQEAQLRGLGGRVVDHVSHRLQDLFAGADPWWHPDEQRFTPFKNRVDRICLACYSLGPYRTFRQKYSAFDLDQILQSALGRSTRVDTREDPYALRIVAYKYGATLSSLASVPSYERCFDAFTAGVRESLRDNRPLSGAVPCYVDRRYEGLRREDRDWKVPPLLQPAEEPLKVLFCVAETDEYGFIKRSGERSYTIDDGLGNRITRRGRDVAQEALRENANAMRNIRQKISSNWNDKLTRDDQMDRLVAIRDRLAKWASRAEPERLKPVLQADIAAIQNKIEAQDYGF